MRNIADDTARLELVQDYRSSKHSVWGINARNREQNFALNLLLDPEIDLVTMLGPAGTGKTLLTLAAGLMQTLDSSLFAEIIMTRVTIPLGEDIGFLPGTEEEKMEPWMARSWTPRVTDAKPKAATGPRRHQRPLRNRIRPLAELHHARPHLPQPVRIIDEAQNLTPKADEGPAHPRARPGPKWSAGNIAQSTRPHLTETTSGLTYVVKPVPWLAHPATHPEAGERSSLPPGF